MEQLFGGKRRVQPVEMEPLTGRSDIHVSVLHLDESDSVAGGNKSYKLKYNLLKARALGKNTVLTFGGAWSNHIAATARACTREGFRSIGFIRGEPVSNPTLERARSDGMELHFIDRTQYRLKQESHLVQDLFQGSETPYIIPEGGSNEDGIKGCEEILEGLTGTFDQAWVACGTGATLAGMICSAHIGICTGVSVLRDQGATTQFVKKNIPANSGVQWQILDGYAFGGYAKKGPVLEGFIEDLKNATGLQTEPVYTGKLFYAVADQIRQGAFTPGTRILIIHTGGLQYLLP